MNPYLEYIKELSQQILPSFVEMLPDTPLWLELKTNKNNPPEDVERLCRLLTLQLVFEEAKNNESLRIQMMTRPGILTGAVVSSAMKTFENISLRLGNSRNIVFFCIQHFPELTNDYYAKNPIEKKVDLDEKNQYPWKTGHQGLGADAMRHTHFGHQADHLKSNILLKFKERIEHTKNLKELNFEVQKIRQSEEYKILNKSQSIFSALSGKATPAVVAFNKMVEEQRTVLRQHQLKEQ